MEFKVARRPYLGNWLPLSICHIYQDFMSASKIISKTPKMKQVKHLLSKINLAQEYYADKLYIIIQNPTDDMIADCLTKPKSPYTNATFEAFYSLYLIFIYKYC